MDIVLRNNLILITTGFETLNASWMKEFLNHHSRGMLFLPKAVLVFRNEALTEIREDFLQQLSEYQVFSHKNILNWQLLPGKIEFHRKTKVFLKDLLWYQNRFQDLI